MVLVIPYRATNLSSNRTSRTVFYTDKGKKRKQEPQPPPQIERLSDQLHGENQALKRCKQAFIEEDHAALHHTISALHGCI
jgi:hypothetical protein